MPYYLYNRKLRKFLFLFNHQSQINNYELLHIESASFFSRDGLIIHGYISFPLHVERSNLPMVLDVHGVPWSRDFYGFDPEVQLFTNRGYICFQINYRGSTGYGKEFTNAGDKEWSGTMLNDLVDAVQ